MKLTKLRVVVTCAGITTAAMAWSGAASAQVPQDSAGRMTGACHVWTGSAWAGGPCPAGHRPFINAEEFGGANRGETGTLIGTLIRDGHFAPGLVFLSRYEDLSAASVAAGATGGVFVQLPGGNGPLDAATLAELRAVSVGATGVVIVGGDGAIGVDQRVEAVRALEGWT